MRYRSTAAATVLVALCILGAPNPVTAGIKIAPFPRVSPVVFTAGATSPVFVCISNGNAESRADLLSQDAFTVRIQQEGARVIATGGVIVDSATLTSSNFGITVHEGVSIGGTLVDEVVIRYTGPRKRFDGGETLCAEITLELSTVHGPFRITIDGPPGAAAARRFSVTTPALVMATVVASRGGEGGPPGPQGPRGERGIAGPQGPVGPQGDKGDRGEQGLEGLRGQQGDRGLDGPEGKRGRAGVDFKGEWSATIAYEANDAVTRGGSTWLARTATTGNDPLTSPDTWAVLATGGERGGDGARGDQGPRGDRGEGGTPGPVGNAGPAGAAGPQGPQGSQGQEGHQGAQGPEGPRGLKGERGDDGIPGAQGPEGRQGRAGMSFKGDWSATTAYEATDVVTREGSTWIAQASTTGNDPLSSPAFWLALATRGARGGDGTPGPVGNAGPAGAAGAKGDQGEKGDAGLAGAAGPKGDRGDAGATGATGSQGATGATGPQGAKGDTGASAGVVLHIPENQPCPSGFMIQLRNDGTTKVRTKKGLPEFIGNNFANLCVNESVSKLIYVDHGEACPNLYTGPTAVPGLSTQNATDFCIR